MGRIGTGARITTAARANLPHAGAGIFAWYGPDAGRHCPASIHRSAAAPPVQDGGRGRREPKETAMMKKSDRLTLLSLCLFLVLQVAAAASLAAGPATAAAAPATADKALFVRLPPVWYPLSYTLPGEFAFRTTRGYYVTAIGGGGRATAPTMVTSTMIAGPWEKFRIEVDPSNAWDKSIRTSMNNYVTAVNGGGMVSDALHTDATQIGSWERFRMIDLAEGRFAPTYYALYTSGSRVVTAVGAGGKYDDAFHTDGYQVGSWEELRPVKCGDLGSGYEYYIIPSNGYMLTAEAGGGQTDGYALTWGYDYGEPDNALWSRFKLVRQSDGWYALQTSSGNYLTALGGGGLVQQYFECDPGWFGACLDSVSAIFHTDATQVSSWEKFRLVDLGNCKYAIQTVSGFYFGLFRSSHGWMFTTRRSTISDNEKFELVMSGLGSPPIIH
jgi:hypothetical protein